MDTKDIAAVLRSKKFINSFPNMEQEAAYNQLFLLIQLDHIDQATFDDIQREVTTDNYLSAATLRHELTHYWDHIGTLWGQQNIKLLFNALNAYAIGDIEEYWRIRLLHKQCKSDEFGGYYTQTFNDFQGTFREPWVTGLSSGVRFDVNGKVDYGLPLLFIRFNRPDGTELARTPISVAALLESNATYQEYKLKNAFVEQMPDGPIKSNEQRLVLEEMEEQFYATDFTVYSVVAHLVAKRNNLNNIVDIYELTSSLATISLNLPQEVIKTIKIKAVFDEEWDKRFMALADNGDRGFAYYRLSENLVDFYGPNQYTLADALDASGLPGQTALELQVLEAMAFNLFDVIPGPFYGMAEALLNYGMTLFSKRGLDGKKPGFEEWAKSEQSRPYFIFSNTFFNPDEVDLEAAFKNMMDNNGAVPLAEHYKVMVYLHDKMNEFVETCGV